MHVAEKATGFLRSRNCRNKKFYSISICPASFLQVGETLIQDFLEKVKSFPAATMSEEEVKVELRRMKQELVSKNNSYIREILARCVSVKTAWNVLSCLCVQQIIISCSLYKHTRALPLYSFSIKNYPWICCKLVFMTHFTYMTSWCNGCLWRNIRFQLKHWIHLKQHIECK